MSPARPTARAMKTHGRCRPSMLLLAAGVAVSTATLWGCASGPRRGTDHTTSATQASSDQTLRDLAAQQDKQPDGAAQTAPPTPGVALADIQPLPAAERAPGSKAMMPLDEVLAQLAGTSPAPSEHDVPPEALAKYVRGRAQLLAGDAAGALTTLDEAATLDPESPEVQRAIAEAQLALSQRTTAIATLAKAVRLGLNDPWAFAMLGRDALRARRIDEAAAWLAKAQRLEDPSPDLAAVLGVDTAEALTQLGYLTGARDSLTRSLARPIGGLALGRFRAEAAEVFRRRADLWRRAGDLSMRLSDAPGAERCYELAATSPGSDRTTFLPRRVQAAMHQGHPARAALLVVDDIRESGGRVEERHLPLLRYLAGQPGLAQPLAQAIDAVPAGLEKAPPPSLRSGLARAAAAVLPPAEARARLAAYLSTSSRDPEAVSDLLVACAPLSPRERADVLAGIVRASPLSAGVLASGLIAYGVDTRETIARLVADSRPEAVVLGSVLMSKTGDPARALERLGTKPPPPPLRGGWLVARVSAQSDAGMREARATAALAAQVLSEPGSGPEDRRAAATCLGIAGDPKGALSLLMPIAGTEPDVLLEAAELCLRTGQAPEAESLLRRAIDADPTDERPYEGLLTLYNTGAPLADNAKLAAAARQLRVALPSSRVIRFVGAQELASRSLWPQAEAGLLSLIGPASEDPQVLSLLVSVWEHAAQGSPEMTARGEGWLRERLQQRPQAPGLAMSLARVLVAQGRAAEADTLLAQRLDSFPQPEVARLREWVVREGLENPAEADRLARARLASAPKTVANVIELADLLSKAGQFDEAATRLGEDLPADAELTTEEAARLVQLLSRLNLDTLSKASPALSEGALRLFDLVTARGATLSPQLMVGRLMLLASAHPEDTQRLLAAVQALGTRYPDLRNQALLQTAQALLQRDDPKPGLRFLPAAAAAAPADAEALLLSEWFRLTGLRGDAEDAEILVKTADPLKILTLLRDRRSAPVDLPDSADFQRAEVAYQLGTDLNTYARTQAAEAMYRMALRLRPDHAWASNNLGYMLLEAGRDLPDAERLIEHAARVLGDEYHVIDSLGWVRYKRGKLRDVVDEAGHVTEPGAVTLLAKAVMLARQAATFSGDGEDPTILDHLGDARWRVGDRAGAESAWRDAKGALGSALDAVDARRNAGIKEAGEPAPDPEFLVNLRAQLTRLGAKLDAVAKGTEPAIEPLHP